jgi:Protein of unknown function (DUF5132)
MALKFEDVTKPETLIAGAGIALLSQVMLPLLRPVVKTALQAGIYVTQNATYAYHSAVEAIQDIAAEVEAERHASHHETPQEATSVPEGLSSAPSPRKASEHKTK